MIFSGRPQPTEVSPCPAPFDLAQLTPSQQHHAALARELLHLPTTLAAEHPEYTPRRIIGEVVDSLFELNTQEAPGALAEGVGIVRQLSGEQTFGGLTPVYSNDKEPTSVYRFLQMGGSRQTPITPGDGRHDERFHEMGSLLAADRPTTITSRACVNFLTPARRRWLAPPPPPPNKRIAIFMGDLVDNTTASVRDLWILPKSNCAVLVYTNKLACLALRAGTSSSDCERVAETCLADQRQLVNNMLAVPPIPEAIEAIATK
jgi:hypothetical protein